MGIIEADSNVSFLAPLPPFLLPFISICFPSLFTLNLCHQPLVLLLIGSVLLLLLTQALSCNEVSVFAEFTHGAFPLSFVLRPKLGSFSALTIRIIMFIWIE